MLRGQAAARLLLVNIGAFRDADQRIMGLVHVCLWEVDVIGGNQWQPHRIGHLDKAAFGRALALGRQATRPGVALQLDIQPVAKNLGKSLHQCLCLWGLRGL